MQLHEFDRRETRTQSTCPPLQKVATPADFLEDSISKYAIDEINAYIAIRDNLLTEAEHVTTRANLRRVRLTNDFVQTCLKPARSPYESQYLPEQDAARERKRCAAVKVRIAELDAQLTLRSVDHAV